jgi:hypothetical protein
MRAADVRHWVECSQLLEDPDRLSPFDALVARVLG